METDDELLERIERLGEDGDSEPPTSGDSERPSQVTLVFDAGKGKIKWGRTLLAAFLAGGSICEVVLELTSKDGPISKLVSLLSH